MTRPKYRHRPHISYERLVEWMEEDRRHYEEVADIVARRAIGILSEYTRRWARKWLETAFLLPTDARKSDLFAFLSNLERQHATERIVEAIRDRLSADEKRGAQPNGAWTKRYLETLEWPQGRPRHTRLY